MGPKNQTCEQTSQVTLCKIALHLQGFQLYFLTAQYKTLIRSAMPLAKQRNDRSTYKITGIEIKGAIPTIKAERFSTLRCYTDSGFFIRVRLGENGKYMIIEEYTETQPHSDC
ncbi:hypothetical protein SCOR_15165 [Sulfidibacter corallicola]